MENQFSRTELLIGKKAMERLKNARVAVFGIGGVGGHVLEALVRSGVGTVDIIDNDRVCLSNLNRQIIATYKTLGMYKVDAAQQRMKEINPEAVIHKYNTFFLPETAEQFDFTQYDYVADAIDTVAGKIELVLRAKEAGIPVISSMGAGNKMDPTAFEVADIYETSVCPLARVMRRELKKRGVEGLKVVYSKEQAAAPAGWQEIDGLDGEERHRGEDGGGCIKAGEGGTGRRRIPGSNAFVPAVAGLIIAGEIIKDLTGSSVKVPE